MFRVVLDGTGTHIIIAIQYSEGDTTAAPPGFSVIDEALWPDYRDAAGTVTWSESVSAEDLVLLGLAA